MTTSNMNPIVKTDYTRHIIYKILEYENVWYRMNFTPVYRFTRTIACVTPPGQCNILESKYPVASVLYIENPFSSNRKMTKVACLKACLMYIFYMTNSHFEKEKFNFPKDEFNFWQCSSLLPMNPLPFIYFHNKIIHDSGLMNFRQGYITVMMPSET